MEDNTVNNMHLEFEIDTGSARSITGRATFQKFKKDTRIFIFTNDLKMCTGICLGDVHRTEFTLQARNSDSAGSAQQEDKQLCPLAPYISNLIHRLCHHSVMTALVVVYLNHN